MTALKKRPDVLLVVNEEEFTVVPRIEDGKLKLNVEICNFELNTWIDPAVEAWFQKDVMVVQKFKMSDVLDTAIDIHTSPVDKTIDADQKELFTTMRSELAEMIQRIDHLKFR